MIPGKFLAILFLILVTSAFAAEDLSQIKWVTNLDDPPIGAPEAIKGGTFNTFSPSYPLTFRLMGPNSNDAFASWNRAFTMDFTLVTRHPNTDNFIPWMATHWSIQDDHRTLYFKLDPDARWSDGRPVTAHDYVFCREMMASEHIVDPYYNTYVDNYFESVEGQGWVPLEALSR